jgi:DNA repair photolyase
MEPRAAAPYTRLKTIEALAKAGIPTTVMVAPMIPGLNDMEMERIMQAARDAGASRAHYNVVRLPYELKQLFEEWLRAHVPDRADHVLSLIRQMRGGKLYDADFSQRMMGQGPYAELIAQRFNLALKRYGFDLKSEGLRKDLFRKPEQNGQLALGL